MFTVFNGNKLLFTVFMSNKLLGKKSEGEKPGLHQNYFMEKPYNVT